MTHVFDAVDWDTGLETVMRRQKLNKIPRHVSAVDVKATGHEIVTLNPEFINHMATTGVARWTLATKS